MSSWRDERDLPTVMALIDNELSEPYSIFTYRYFLRNWPQLCYLVFHNDTPFGTVVCKMDVHRDHLRGYVAMLVVDKTFRGKGIGSELVKLSIQQMIAGGCEEVVLEAEVCNSGALRLYHGLGFIRDKRLHRYYLNGIDAYRLKLLLPLSEEKEAQLKAEREAEWALMELQSAGGAKSTEMQEGEAAEAGFPEGVELHATTTVV
ncbi:MAG: hypothetical protein WDW38_009900 [Sanguina aurantia]